MSNSVKSIRRAVERLVVAGALGVGLGACGGPQTAPEPIDVGAELDRLFTCGLTELATRGAIGWSTMERREAATEWARQELERERTTLRVFMHPAYGPGVNVEVSRQRWVGAAEDVRDDGPQLLGGAVDGSVGWVPIDPGDEAVVVERRLVAATAQCWSGAAGD